MKRLLGMCRRPSPLPEAPKMTSTSTEPAQVASIHATCCSFSQVIPSGSYCSDSEPCPRYEASLGKDGIYRPEVMQTIERKVDELSPELRELSLKIHSHPEIMFEEKYAHDTLTAFMSAHGFDVTPHYKDMPTAWRASFTYGAGKGRVLGVNSEMDALPGIGHACGHNLIAIAGVGVALAVAAALKEHAVDGTVVLLGTPAEEGGNGKGMLVSRGAYQEMDACVMCHPGPGREHTVGLAGGLAVQSIDVGFFGHTAHASAAPWEGTNALDAAFLAYSSISVLRQQMRPDHKVHGVIKGPGNLAANVIPDYTRMLWLVRAPSRAEMIAFRERVVACLKAAALATSCTCKIETDEPVLDLRQNVIMGNEFAGIASGRYGHALRPALGPAVGSTDFGNVSYEVPALHPDFSIPTEPGGINHTPAFTASAKTIVAHEETLVTVKALALTGFRVIDDDDWFAKVKGAFDNDNKTHS